ncbi:MAG: hypothetical protein ACOYXS_00600 [Chloroflexota bacterium]
MHLARDDGGCPSPRCLGSGPHARPGGSAGTVRRRPGRAQSPGTSVYDAAYLVVARLKPATLITADRQLYEVGVAAGDDLAWLGDLPA